MKRKITNVHELREWGRRKVVSASLLIIGFIGLIIYKDPIIIEMGLFGAFCDMVYETYATKKKWWSYDSSKSHYMIRGTLPIGVVVTYFAMGMFAATYILFRLS